MTQYLKIQGSFDLISYYRREIYFIDSQRFMDPFG
jgi:hypothetical protein